MSSVVVQIRNTAVSPQEHMQSPCESHPAHWIEATEEVSLEAASDEQPEGHSTRL